MKHKTVKTTPLKSDTIVLHIETPMIRKRFAPRQHVHNTDKRHKRKMTLMEQMEAIDHWCDKHWGKEPIL